MLPKSNPEKDFRKDSRKCLPKNNSEKILEKIPKIFPKDIQWIPYSFKNRQDREDRARNTHLISTQECLSGLPCLVYRISKVIRFDYIVETLGRNSSLSYWHKTCY